ncbi:MAG: VanZ family protein [Verrucomicrobia bacterium]|nr:VanZ family protein [Verrucomicrobiota bacterium]
MAYVSSNLTGPTTLIFDFGLPIFRLRNPTETEIRRRQWLWPLLVAGLIFYASSRSVVAGPEIPNIDKVVHFLIHGLLATLLCRMGTGWRAAAWAWLAASAYGASDEWHQYFVPGRSCSLADWIADTTGAALAVSLYRGVAFYRRALEARLGRPRPGVESSDLAATVGAK